MDPSHGGRRIHLTSFHVHFPGYDALQLKRFITRIEYQTGYVNMGRDMSLSTSVTTS